MAITESDLFGKKEKEVQKKLSDSEKIVKVIDVLEKHHSDSDSCYCLACEVLEILEG